MSSYITTCRKKLCAGIIISLESEINWQTAKATKCNRMKRWYKFTWIRKINK